MRDPASLEAGALVFEPAPAERRALRLLERENQTPLRQAELGLAAAAHSGLADDDPALGPLAERIAARARASDWPFARAMRALLAVAARRRSPMLNGAAHVEALARLASAWRAWRRHPDDWDARPPDARRQFGSLARHLLAEYPVPACFDSAWLHDCVCAGAQQRWFIHVGTGHNLRTAPGLPFPLTKAMAHHAMLAPPDLTIFHALRWGQVGGLGGGERLARAVIASRLRTAAPPAHEPFWLTVIQFMAAHPMLDPEQVGPIIDYLHHQRFEPTPARVVNGVVVADGRPPQPELSMKGRTPASLVRHVEDWHDALGRSMTNVDRQWSPCGIAGFACAEGEPPEQRLFTVTELLDGRELLDEGRSLAHCVGIYAQSCERRRCAIFSLREDAGRGPQRRVTVEVTLPDHVIVQACGRRNRHPDVLERRLLHAWAAAAGLTVAEYAFRL